MSRNTEFNLDNLETQGEEELAALEAEARVPKAATALFWVGGVALAVSMTSGAVASVVKTVKVVKEGL
jgi:hypothetical protein